MLKLEKFLVLFLLMGFICSGCYYRTTMGLVWRDNFGGVISMYIDKDIFYMTEVPAVDFKKPTKHEEAKYWNLPLENGTIKCIMVYNHGQKKCLKIERADYPEIFQIADALLSAYQHHHKEHSIDYAFDLRWAVNELTVPWDECDLPI